MTTPLFPQPFLPKGSKGDAVIVLQLLLLVLGYNNAIIPDGDYGDETTEGVKKFQEDSDLQVDGDFGPKSRAMFWDRHGVNLDNLPAFSGGTLLPGETQQEDLTSPAMPKMM